MTNLDQFLEYWDDFGGVANCTCLDDDGPCENCKWGAEKMVQALKEANYKWYCRCEMLGVFAPDKCTKCDWAKAQEQRFGEARAKPEFKKG